MRKSAWKKLLCCMLALTALGGSLPAEAAADAGAQAHSVGPLALPESSATLSKTLALQLLTLCTGHTADKTAALFRASGFEVLLQRNYDKDLADCSHTCAYTLGRKSVSYGGEQRTALLLAVRGSNGGEWFSNFDFAPSRSNETVFAENFLFTAQDVLQEIEETVNKEENPLLLLCGHSRGAACANLLGVLMNERYGAENLFVYTYATPATVRGAAAERECGNIFNFINPCDLVPRVPLEVWGFARAGRDILLSGAEDAVGEIDETMERLSGIAPDIESYYGVRYSLTDSGESEQGVTAFEAMLTLSASFAGTQSGEKSAPAAAVSEESGLYPLFEELQKLESGEGMNAVLSQHMPQTYAALISAWKGEK